MILAAGLGMRMRPLTEKTPKPMLEAGGMPLIERQVRTLVAAGFREFVINVHYLADQITGHLKDGAWLGADIVYSHEPQLLDSGGGIRNALPLLGEFPFLVVSADTWHDFDFTAVPRLAPHHHAHLVIAPQPDYLPRPDFHWDLQRRRLTPSGGIGCNWARIAVLRGALFEGEKSRRFPLIKVLQRAIVAHRLGVTYWEGQWLDVGTPDQLAELDARLTFGFSDDFSGMDDFKWEDP